jgi:tryptophanyl-tRNA synthetase
LAQFKVFHQMAIERVLSGMRPTGNLHLGHYNGVLKNWLKLQHEHECLFFVADWHALTTHYDTPEIIEESVWEMVIDWLAAGVDPASATIFIQSRVPEHAELHTLLSMITPLSWLERVPTYKDQQEKLSSKDLSTYGFLGYPLLQSADILIYKATQVPVGEDQIPHIEFTREIARRFNHIYGKEAGFEEKAEAAIKKLGNKRAALYEEMRNAYQQSGDEEALDAARAMIEEQQGMSMGDKERLLGYLEGGGKMILLEPDYKLTPASKMPGLDGQKMSKSYNNTISLREDVDTVAKKIKTMPTDPARIRRTDPGDPAKCPVWQLHQVYSDQSTQDWAQNGCKTAGIGCIECKGPVIEGVLAELKPIQERAAQYAEDPSLVKNIVAEGCEKARKLARETMRDVRDAMGLNYS